MAIPSKLKFNRKNAFKSVIAGLVFISLLLTSLSLSHYWLTHQLTSVAEQIEQKYQQRHRSAKAQMLEVQAMLQQEQESYCSDETINLLKQKLFKQSDQPVPWVRFINDNNYICSAIGRWPVPAGGQILSRDIDGHGLVRGDDARTFNKQQTIYASVIDSAAKVFVPVQSAEAIFKVLAKCQMCGGIKVNVNGIEWINQNTDGNPFSSISYQAENSEFSYTLIANESARNQLWLMVFLLLLLPTAALVGIGYLARNRVLKFYWHHRFASALKKGAFYLAYQPIINTDNRQVFGVETLLRWRKQNGECRETSSYIKLLEQDAVMQQLTIWMIKTALSELKSLLRSNQIARCSINISAKQIENQNLLTYLQLLADQGYPVDQLCFELTERQPIASWQAIREFIAGCRQLGCRIKLDDVGVGYGGGLLMQQLSFDCLKVNKAFTKMILSEHHQPFLLRSYICIAQEMGVNLIAEGVESQEQAQYLKDLGIHLHQGWLYSKALPATELRQYLLDN